MIVPFSTCLTKSEKMACKILSIVKEEIFLLVHLGDADGQPKNFGGISEGGVGLVEVKICPG